MKAVIFIALIIGGAYYFYNSNQSSIDVDFENLDSNVKKLAKLMADKPGRKVTIGDLQVLSQALNNSDDESSTVYLTRLIALAMIAKKDTRSFLLFRKKVERENPDAGYFDFMDDDFPGVCSQCEGKGGAKCTYCKGKGSCGNNLCNKGKLRYETFEGKFEEKNCPVCKGTTECRQCEGSGSSINAVCSTCKGTGQKSVSAKKAFRLYKDALKDAE